MFELPKNIQRRYESAKAKREDWRSYLDDVYHYIIPNRNYWDNVAEDHPEGDRKNTRVYDITAPLAARSLVGKLFSTLTPPFRRWSMYVPGSDVPEQNKDDASELLQKQNEILFDFINRSNFPLAVTECYFDLIAGTAALIIDEGDDDNLLIFSCEPIKNLAFEEDSNGIINNIYRDHIEMPFRDIENKWPNAKIPDAMTNQANKNSEVKFDIMDCIIFDEEKKEYTYYVVWKENNTVIFDETTKSQKFIVFRWSKLPGEVLGRGIALDVLPSVKSLNVEYGLVLEAAELGAFPPLLSFSDGVFNSENIRLSPKTIIPVKGIGEMAGSPLKALELNQNLQLAELPLQDIREWIRKAFYDEPLGSVNAPKKTATEVSIRQQQFLEDIGAPFGRLEIEFLNRVIDRCTFILRKRGELSKELIIDGTKVTLEHQSPLAQLQNQQDMENFSLADQMLGAVLGDFKIAAYKLERIPKWLAEKANSDESVYKSQEDLQRLAKDIKTNLLAQLGDKPTEALPQPQALGSPQTLLPTQNQTQ